MHSNPTVSYNLNKEQGVELISKCCGNNHICLVMSFLFKLIKCIVFSLQLNDGGKAAEANMTVGDIIMSINGISADCMNHLEAQNKIKACTGNLSLTLQR